LKSAVRVPDRSPRGGTRGASPVAPASPTMRCSWRSRPAAKLRRRRANCSLKDGKLSADWPVEWFMTSATC
jgi:hypothetical protein